MPRFIRDAIVALSLANICFLSPWLVLLNSYHYTYYNWPADPGFVEVKALIICILLLGFLFWLAASILRQTKSSGAFRIARLALLLVLILPINSFISDYLRVSLFGLVTTHRWFLIVALALGIGLLVIVYRYERQLVRAAITLLIILSPLVLVNLASAIWLRNKYSSPAESFRQNEPVTAVSSHRNGPHVLWIIFDELDQHTAFSSRAAGTKLPEFDRFRKESLSSSNAYPPNQFTLLSIPALTTGQPIAYSTPVAANDCALTLANGQTVNWSTQSNVFSQARSEGFTTGVVGWYHPYCRVLSGSLDFCSWVPVIDQVNPALDRLSLQHAMWISLRTALFRIPFAFRLFESQYEHQRKLDHQEEFVRISRAATTLLTQDLNLKLLHFPVPHHPWIYDANRNPFSDAAGNHYVDNLALADRVLGEVRAALEESSQWNGSIVLVTSDHWWREAEKVNGKRDHRIPFMLKLAGQKEGMEYQKPFNTILTRELLLQLLRGNLTTPAEVSAWLDRQPLVHTDD